MEQRLTAEGSYLHWCNAGRLSRFWHEIKTSGQSIGIVKGVFPAGNLSSPTTPDLILAQYLGESGMRIKADIGGGRFKGTSERGGFYLVAPNFSNSIDVDDTARVCDIAFDTRVWRGLFDGASRSSISFDFGALHSGMFTSTMLQSKVRRLLRLIDEEEGVSLLLAQAAGCEILAELSRLSGSRLASARGGLSPWAERRCLELIHARVGDDISLEDLATEVGLSPYHFLRMFKKNVGVPPRAYLQQLRIAKACEMLEKTDRSITEIALDVGYSSNQVLARVFLKHQKVSPSEYRRKMRPASIGRQMHCD